MSAASSSPVRGAWGAVAGAALLVVAGIVFFLIYITSSSANSHAGGLTEIGILALVFALGSYLAQSLGTDPLPFQVAQWSFTGFGFAVLFLTLLWLTFNLIGVIVVLLLVVVVALAARWGAGARASEERRGDERRNWQSSSPPSAFSYTAAQAPGGSPPPPIAASGPTIGSEIAAPDPSRTGK
ncbi:MAG: hypothetical protein L3K03_08625 [Thermoplasmata archaeon]|nr:hypothetical protein [Thermoplasmata archaeon]